MKQSQTRFDERLQRLSNERDKMVHGHERVMRPDGLVVARALPARDRVTIRPVAVLIVVFLLFKAVLIASVGEATYKERVDRLRHGNLVEHAGAVIMQVEPVSNFLAQQLRPYLR